MYSSATSAIDHPTAVWRLDWLTPLRCRIILVVLLALGLFSHVWYLHNNCPLDLSPDEAQYWDWSRRLDISYYSKGPLVAYLIGASCAIFGDTMPAVRYPAIVLAVCTSIVTYLLTRKLFGSERLALGAVLLFHLVPMFIAGSVLMTIDPPMFLCWAIATYFAAGAIFDDRRWMWVLAGAVIGIGFLAKYAAFLWFVGLFGFLVFHGNRRQLVAALLAPIVASLFAIPVIVWNARHDWVSLRHVATQTGATDGAFAIQNLFVLLGSQIGLVGPTLAVIMVAGTVRVWRKTADPHRYELLLLMWIGGAYFALNVVASLRAKVQPNWPAPAYFTLMIVTAWFLADRLQTLQTWKPWRGWFYASVVIGVLFIPIAHDTAVIYPVLKLVSQKTGRDVSDMDSTTRLRGWAMLGEHVSNELQLLQPGAFVFCDDYQQTAEMAFYVRGQPVTYCAGSYYGKRLSQYDMWPDRRLDDPASPLIGRDAIYIGKGVRAPPQVEAAFDSVQKMPELDIIVAGEKIRSFKLWRCHSFKGMQRRSGSMDY